MNTPIGNRVFQDKLRCVANFRERDVEKSVDGKKIECGPMSNVIAALPNIGGVLCSTP